VVVHCTSLATAKSNVNPLFSIDIHLKARRPHDIRPEIEGGWVFLPFCENLCANTELHILKTEASSRGFMVG
jgi:hypothetical protein